MNDRDIARRAGAAEDRKAGQARARLERVRRREERALAEGSRLEIVEDGEGSELRVAPRPFPDAFRDLPALLLVLVAILVIGGAAVAGVVANAIPGVGLPLGTAALAVPYLFGLALGIRWFLGTVPLRLRVTPEGHAALWHRRRGTAAPTWVGPKESFHVRLDAYGIERHLEQEAGGEPEGPGWGAFCHGWTEIGLSGEGGFLRNAGPAYFLNGEDAKRAGAFLKKHGIVW